MLLKNTGPVLPIGTGTSSIAVIGDDAGTDAMTQGGGSAGGQRALPGDAVPGHQDPGRRGRQRHLLAGHRQLQRGASAAGQHLPDAEHRHRHRPDRVVLQQHRAHRYAGA